MSKWVDFKQLREQLDFEAVLKHFDVEVKRNGDRHQGFCPLPNHEGNRRSPSFSADLARGIWQCFGCGSKGNTLDFAAFMEGIDPANGAALRSVALKLQTAFGLTSVRSSPAARSKPEWNGRRERQPAASQCQVNAPLNFELKGLDAEHPYLRDRGFTAETIKHFGLGYCSRGLLKSRIAIPLHDQAGQLIGYAGRLVDDGAIGEAAPKYLFPGNRERQGITHEFRKSSFVYGGHLLQSPVERLVLVEGFPSVWWLWQAGITNAVALMGASCSPEQADLAVQFVLPGGHIIALTDGDDAGERCAMSIFAAAGGSRPIRWLKMDHGRQPTDYKPELLIELLA